MRFNARLLFATGCLALGSCGCSDGQDEAGAQELLERVKAAQYRTWDRAPGYETRHDSKGPHGGSVDIYVNDVVARVLASGEHDGTWPAGSLIAKDGFNGSTQNLTALMEKRADGWFWAEYDSDGHPSYAGHPDVCINCHTSGSDFVRAFPLP